MSLALVVVIEPSDFFAINDSDTEVSIRAEESAEAELAEAVDSVAKSDHRSVMSEHRALILVLFSPVNIDFKIVN